MLQSAKITLVGAGPGALDLITLRGMKALEQADVVLYDALVDKRLLDYAPEHARKIYVGKRRNYKAFTQDEINALMVDCAKHFGKVVRLKGGDPYVFGRGAEEVAFAEAHSIETEVVPGITSAVAVPQSAGISLTHRGIAGSFWVVTATDKHGRFNNDLQWAARSSATVVILMGMAKLQEIADAFVQAGKKNTPVAIIQNGTCENEKRMTASVNNLVGKAKSKNMASPAVIVIGEVVRLYKPRQMAGVLKELML